MYIHVHVFLYIYNMYTNIDMNDNVYLHDDIVAICIGLKFVHAIVNGSSTSFDIPSRSHADWTCKPNYIAKYGFYGASPCYIDICI